MAYRRSYSPPRPARWMDLRYRGTCHVCGCTIDAGQRGFYDPETKQVTCTKITCAQADGLVKEDWIGSPTTGHWVTSLAAQRVGQSAPMIDGHPIEYHPHQRGVFRYTDGTDNRWLSRTRYGIRAGANATGIRCEDAPCCGCCD